MFKVLVVLNLKEPEEIRELLRKLGRAHLYIPRPVRAEVLRELDKYVEEYHMPPSTYRRLSRAARKIVENRVKIERRRGRYAKIDLEVFGQIVALRKAGASIREIARTLDLPKSTVHYVLNHAKKIEDSTIRIILSDGEDSQPSEKGDQA